MLYKSRFAPSPTGLLHLGGARTAIISYLASDHCILRIDDSDQKRSRSQYSQDIMKCLGWIGLSFARCYKQSQRHHIYDQFFDQICHLVTPDDGGYRYHVPHNKKITWSEPKRPLLSIDSDTLDNFVIRRRDGSYTYNYCSVVDDITDGINLIIRGEDHICNTAKQILIFNLFKAEVPTFCHIPLLLDSQERKLSKRSDDSYFYVSSWIERGVLPEALVNYLSSTIWSEVDKISSLAEAKQQFSLKLLRNKPSCFNETKLMWYSKQWLSKLDSRSVEQRFTTSQKHPSVCQAIARCKHLHSSITTLESCVNELLSCPTTYEPVLKSTPDQLLALVKVLDVCEDPYQSLQDYFKQVDQDLVKDLRTQIRVALTGKKLGMSLADLFAVLPVNEIVQRLANYTLSLPLI